MVYCPFYLRLRPFAVDDAAHRRNALCKVQPARIDEDGILRFHQLWPGEVPYYQVSGTVERDADALHTDIYAFYTGGAG